MKKFFMIGKFAYRPKSKKSNTLIVNIELNNIDTKPSFSASCDLWNCENTDIVAGGQSFETFLEWFPELRKNELFMKIYNLWYRNHLNDMDASANEAQRNAVKEYCDKHNGYDYNGVCNFLKKKNLYTVEVDGKECKYGHEWYYRPIPSEDMIEILKLFLI